MPINYNTTIYSTLCTIWQYSKSSIVEIFKHRSFLNKGIPLLIFIFALILYTSTRSISLDDWDSVQFAMGVERFDISAHHPHPPGYAFYICCGKTINLLIGDPKESLILMSAILGALTVLVFFYLVKINYGQKTALFSSLLLTVVPIFWLTSLKALSDIPATFFIYLTLYLTALYISRKQQGALWLLYLSAVSAGIGIGFRPQNAFALIPIIAVPTLKDFKLSRLFIVFLIVILITISWLLVIIIHNGIEQYAKVSYSQFCWRLDKPNVSVLASSFSLKYLIHRLYNFFISLVVNSLGFGTSDYVRFSIMLITVVGGLLFLMFVPGKNRFIKTNLIWMVAYFIMIYIFLPPDNPRYYCPLVPVIVMVVVRGWLSFRSGLLAVVLLIICNFHFTGELAKQIHKYSAPPEKTVTFIQSTYEPEKVVIFSRSVFRHLQYYLSKKWKIKDRFTPEDILNEVKNGKKVLCDFNPHKIFSDNQIETLKIRRLRTYKRNPLIHNKHNTVKIYEIKLRQK